MASTKILARALSTSSTAAQMVKPPVQVFGLEGRYATALYSAATKTKQLDAVEKELGQFQASIKSDPKLKDFIIDPTIKRSVKSESLRYLSSQTKLSPSTGNLLALLAENGRLGKVDGVINAFKIIMAAHRGEVTCEVITASPLDASQRQALEAALKKFLKGSESLHLTAKVDPSILGGMIVSIADKYVDMSVASKVKKYTEVISAAL